MNKAALIVELQAKNRALEGRLHTAVQMAIAQVLAGSGTYEEEEPALPRIGEVSTIEFIEIANKLLRTRAMKLTRHLNQIVGEMEGVQVAMKLSSEMLLVATETALHESDRAKENDADS